MSVPCFRVGVMVTWRSDQAIDLFGSGHGFTFYQGSLFGLLHDSRLLFGAELELNNHLNINEVVLEPSKHITRLLEAVDIYYEYPAGPLLVNLTWPDPTWSKCMKTSSVIKTNMIFVISAPKSLMAATLYVVLSGSDFPDFWVIDLTSEVTIWPYDLKTGYR